MEAAVSRLINPHRQASSTYLSLTFYSEADEVALEGVGFFFRELAEEKHKGAQLLLEMWKQWGSCTLVQDGQKLSPNERSASVDPWRPP